MILVAVPPAADRCDWRASYAVDTSCPASDVLSLPVVIPTFQTPSSWNSMWRSLGHHVFPLQRALDLFSLYAIHHRTHVMF